MSIFNLNEMSTMGNGTVKVFNNGIAGKVENVKVTVTKKEPGEGERNPDYKIVYIDKNGSELGDGLYYNRVEPREGYSAEESAKKASGYVNRILSIANAVVAEGFVYPEVNSAREAMDTLLKIIKENSEGKFVNVFTSYGTKQYPSTYLGVRYFDFIEKADNTGYSRLIPKGDDMMERPVADAPKTEQSTSTTTSGTVW